MSISERESRFRKRGDDGLNTERESRDGKRGDDGLKTNHVFVLNTDMTAYCLYTAWYEM